MTLDEYGGPRTTRQDSYSLVAPATDFEQVCGAAQAALRISLSLSFPHHSPALYRVPGVEISTRGFGHDNSLARGGVYTVFGVLSPRN